MTQKYRLGGNKRTIIIQKEIRNFENGGKLLSVWWLRGNPLVMELKVGSHPNFQIPLSDDDFDPETLYRFKMRKLDV